MAERKGNVATGGSSFFRLSPFPSLVRVRATNVYFSSPLFSPSSLQIRPFQRTTSSPPPLLPFPRKCVFLPLVEPDRQKRESSSSSSSSFTASTLQSESSSFSSLYARWNREEEARRRRKRNSICIHFLLLIRRRRTLNGATFSPPPSLPPPPIRCFIYPHRRTAICLRGIIRKPFHSPRSSLLPALNRISQAGKRGGRE